jgi:predicted acyltransferase
MRMTPGGSQSGQRLLALDVFRGATVAGMILVNNPGSWGAIYAPLRHAAWHGWTPTDLVFPFFLFIVGVALVLSTDKRLAAGVSRSALVPHVLRRAAVLVGLGLFLNAYPKLLPQALLGLGEQSISDVLAHMRWPGVLQRIGVCYGITGLLYLFVPKRALLPLGALLLLGHAAVLAWVPAPGSVTVDLESRGDHLSGWLDRVVLGEGHLWVSAKVYDPEGILSTASAVVTCLLGVAVGHMLRREGAALADRVLGIAVAGIALAAAGHFWGFGLPINKPLWTGSYSLLTAGLAAQFLALSLYVCDIRGHRRVVEPFRVFGVNPITVFVGSAVVAKTLSWIRFADGAGRETTLRTWIYENLFLSWADGHHASLAYALAWVTGWFLVLRAMDRRGIHVRV